MMKTKCAVHYANQRHQLSIKRSDSLLESLRKAKIPVPFSCGGEGICTTCRVIIASGDVTARTTLESERALERAYSDNERLSCQCFPTSENLEIKIP